ncbi:MAG TPA: BA14K family protein [Xanthobacteraceae bacterium]|nr:BA14K family protein [Xanthobacteraceae bacterium]
MRRESTIRTKLIRAGSALALASCTAMIGAAPAAARSWHHHGWGWGGAVAAGVIGGAIAAATSPFWGPGYDYYSPGYVYAPGYAYPAYTYGRAYAYEPRVSSGVGYCEAHFRSYNPATGTYLGYDGHYHHCP